MNNNSFLKRQKELKRKEKQKEKEIRKAARKQGRGDDGEVTGEGGLEGAELEGVPLGVDADSAGQPLGEPAKD